MAKTQRWNVWEKILAACVLILLAAMAVYGFKRVQWSDELASLKQELRDAGYPVTAAQLNAWYAAPAGQNAADLYIRLDKQLVRLPRPDDDLDETNLTDEQRRIKKRWDSIPWLGGADEPEPGRRLDEATLAIIRGYLDENRQALATLHEAAKIDGCRYPCDFTKGLELLLPYIFSLRNGSHLLNLESLVYAHAGRGDEAIGSLEAMYRVAMSLEREPVVISRMVHMAITREWLGAMERAAALVNVDDVTLAGWQEQTRRAEASDGLTRAVVGDYAAMNGYFNGTLFIPKISGHEWAAYRVVVGPRDELVYTRYMKSLIELSRTGPGKKRLDSVRQQENTIVELPRYCLLTRLLAPALTGAFQVNDSAIADLRVSRAALAAKRYQLKHGKWPDSLDAVVGGFLDEVPVDPFSLKSVKYLKRAEGGVMVYSVGEDGTDNGGNRYDEKGKSFRDGTDIVFTVQ